MKKYFFLLLVVGAATACSKDKYETKPQLKFKSANYDVVPLSATLEINIEFTDKEGDVSDSIFFVRQRLNKRGPLTLPVLPYKIPDFPNTSKGEFQVNLNYSNDLTLQLQPIRIPGSNPSRNEPDTLNLKFVAKDKGGNKSDTLTLSNVIVIR